MRRGGKRARGKVGLGWDAAPPAAGPEAGSWPGATAEDSVPGKSLLVL